MTEYRPKLLIENRNKIWGMVLDSINGNELKNAAEITCSILDANKDSHLTLENKLHEHISEKLGEIKLSEEQFVKLAEITALLTHIEKTSNFATAYNNESIDIIGETISKLRSKGLGKNEIMEHFSGISVDDVITMHPTYVGTLEYTELLQKLDTAIEHKNSEATRGTIKELLDINPIVKDKRMAEDESAISLHFLKNANQSIPELYEKFDKAFIRNGIVRTDEEKWNFALDITERSWGLGGGDKDGNSNVFASTTEMGIKMNRQQMIELLTEDLGNLAEHSEKFKKSEKYIKIKDNLEKIGEVNPYDNDADFVKKTLLDVYSTLKDVYFDKSSSTEAKKDAIGIKQKFDTFCLTAGRIEYRETADIHQHVLSNIIPEEITQDKKYSELSDDEKKGVVGKLLKNENGEIDRAKEWVENTLKTVPEESKESYEHDSKNGNQGITFNTIKRLELASKNPDIVKGQVLAEAESILQLKEMLLLLKSTGNGNNIRLVPLYEQESSLADAGNITSVMLNDSEYRSYLVAVSLNEWKHKEDKGLVQHLSQEIKESIEALNPQNSNYKEQLEDINKNLAEQNLHISDILKVETQIAHSDNARRSSTTGAKGGIYQAHDDVRKAAEEKGFGAVFHEGGSHTDSLRMGMRSEVGLINTYRLFESVKSTIQGIDSVMMNNSLGRFVNRHLEILCHCASKLEPKREASRRLSGTTLKKYVIDKIHDFGYVIDPLTKQIEAYQENFFEDTRFGVTMAQVLNYGQNKEDGNVGLRKAGRVGGDDLSLFIDPVSGTRTIGFSETGQHKNIHFGFLGAGDLKEKLVDAVDKKKEEFGDDTIRNQLLQKELAKIKTNEDKIKYLYDHSSATRSSIDPGAAYGTAATNICEVWRRAMLNNDGSLKGLEIGYTNKNSKLVVTGTETIKKRPEPSELGEMAKEGNMAGFLAKVEVEYRKAASLAYAALTGKKLDVDDDVKTVNLMVQIREEMPDHKERLERLDMVIALSDFLEDKVGDNSRVLHHLRAFSVMAPSMSQAGKRMRTIENDPSGHIPSDIAR